MRSKDVFELIAGIGAGAALMYLLDPKMGPKRRRHLKSKAGHALDEAGHFIGDTWHNLADHASDLGHNIGSYASHVGHDIGSYARHLGEDVRDYYGKYGRYTRDASRRAQGAGEALLDYGRAYADDAGTYGRRLSKRARRLGHDLSKGASRHYADYSGGAMRQMGHYLSDAGHGISSALTGLFHRPSRRHSYFSRHSGHHEHSTASLISTAAACALLGAGLMFIFDPSRGRRRRALARDKMIRAAHATSDFARDTGRYVSDRTRGLAHEAKARIYEPPVSDRTLVERVRAEMGRAVSNASAITVTAHDGCVTLSGPCLRSEAPALIARVESVRGVKRVQNHMDLHETPGTIPGLQGTGRQH